MLKRRLLAVLVVGVLFASALVNVTSEGPSRGAAPNSDSEPNDSVADATEITSNSITIPGTLNGADDSDVYKILLNNTGGTAESVTFLVDFNTSVGVSVEVLDANGFQHHIAYDDNADNKNFKVVSGFTQFFYINISTQMGDASYSLTSTKVSGAFSGNSNNDPTQAQTLTGDNTPVNSNLDGMTPGDTQDFFKISLTSSPTSSDLLVAYMDQPASADFWVQFYKDAGGGVYTILKQGKGAQAGADVILSYGATENIDVVIRIFAKSGSGAFVLKVQKTAINTDNNNDYLTATGVSLTGDHTWSTTGEVGESIDVEDWYSLGVANGQFINVSITSEDYDATTTLPMIYLELLRSDHLTDYWDPNETDAQVDPDGYTNGTANENSALNYIKVYVIGGGGGGRYSLDLLTDRPPKVKAGVDPVHKVDENTVDTALDLDNVFEDADASDSMVFTFEKGDAGTVGFEDDSNLSISIGANGVVTITPKSGTPRGWTGSGPVTFTATDPYGLQSSIEFDIQVKGVNHEPHVMAPYNTTYSFPEPVLLIYDEPENERNSTINLKDVFGDDDIGDVLNFDLFTENELWIEKDTSQVMGKTVLNGATINGSVRIGFTKESNLIDHKGPITIYITDPAKTTKEDHDVVVFFEAQDDGDPPMTSPHRVKMHIMVRSPGGNPPEWRATFTKISFDEDDPVTLDLDDYVIDVDKADADGLEYEISGYGTDITVSQVDRNRYTFSAAADWNGLVEDVSFKVTDTFGFEAETTVDIEVKPVVDAPVEDPASTSPSTASTFTLNENGQQNFTVGVKDPDGPVDQLSYVWYLDDEVQIVLVNDTFIYKPGYSDEGDHVIKVIVTDDADTKLEFNVTWNVKVLNVNRPPTGVNIVNPEHNTSFKFGKKIEFKAATATDPDGDTVSYSWLMDGNPIPGGGNQTFEYKKMKPGEHVITLEVSDGNGGLTKDEVTIKIKKKPAEGPGFEAGLVILALAAIGLIVLRKRR